MTNREIIMQLELLKKLSDVRGKFGWYIYRNYRILSEACAEALKLRDEAIVKYGVKNENGTFSIDPSNDGWTEYLAEIEPVLQIRQEVKLCRISREEFDALAENADLSAMGLMTLDEIIVER